MRREHWRVWPCSLGCTNATFGSAQELIDHNKSHHAADQESSWDEDGTMAVSSVPDISKARGPCPLCVEVVIANDKIYGKHVGEHLERLALFVLPNPPYEDSSDEDGFQDDSNNDDDDGGDDDDDGASDGGVDNDGQPTTRSNETKPADPSKTSQQPKRSDWDSYLQKRTNEMYPESSSQQPENKPLVVPSRNRTRDPDAPPTYTAAAMEAKEKFQEEERKKDAERHRQIMSGRSHRFAHQRDMDPDRVAALEDVSRNMFKPVRATRGPSQSRPTNIQPQPEGYGRVTRYEPYPPVDNDIEGGEDMDTFQHSEDRSRSLSRSTSHFGEYESDNDRLPANPTSPTPSTQAADKGKGKEARPSQGRISSFFSKKEEPQGETSGSASATRSISSFFSKKTKKPEPAERVEDPYANQHPSPVSQRTQSSGESDDDIPPMRPLGSSSYYHGGS